MIYIKLFPKTIQSSYSQNLLRTSSDQSYREAYSNKDDTILSYSVALKKFNCNFDRKIILRSFENTKQQFMVSIYKTS